MKIKIKSRRKIKRGMTKTILKKKHFTILLFIVYFFEIFANQFYFLSGRNWMLTIYLYSIYL